VPHAILLVFRWLAREFGDRQWHFTGARRTLTIYGMDCKRDDLLQQDCNGDCYGATIRWVRAAKEPDWIVFNGTV